jgi:hypothetical protein
MKLPNFENDLRELINRYSKENDSDTPDTILAQYMNDCLKSFTEATRARDRWYNFRPWEQRP